MALKDETLEDRFYRNVKIGEDNECWLWLGNRNSAGYGQMTWHKQKYAAHRLAFELFYGKPTKRNVCHTCDVRGCCNPKHLFEATQSENMKDCVAKGRISHVILANIAKTSSTPESREQIKRDRAIRRASGPLRDQWGRRIREGQVLPPRQRDKQGHFIKRI